MTIAPEKLGPLVRAYNRVVAERGVYIYAIQAGEGGPIKIGQTNDPATRLKTLQTGNAETLIGLAAWRALPIDEKLLHEEFAHLRIRGEWFEPDPELIDHVMLVFCDWETA